MKKVFFVIVLAFVGQYFVGCTNDSVEEENYEYQIDNEEIKESDLKGIDNGEVKDDDI
jgi:uncharacterized alpha/beta hydrolase family protein